jgi:hypothetical protein
VPAMLFAVVISLAGLQSDRSHRNSSVGGNERCSVIGERRMHVTVPLWGLGLILGVLLRQCANDDC